MYVKAVPAYRNVDYMYVCMYVYLFLLFTGKFSLVYFYAHAQVLKRINKRDSKY